MNEVVLPQRSQIKQLHWQQGEKKNHTEHWDFKIKTNKDLAN